MDTPTLTYFHTPGPPRAKLKGGPGYKASIYQGPPIAKLGMCACVQKLLSTIRPLQIDFLFPVTARILFPAPAPPTFINLCCY